MRKQSADGFLSVANWEKYQHYGDKRNPPWIKLYNSTLDDYEFACLSDSSKLLLTLTWLLASKHDNKIPNNPKWIKRQLPFDGVVDYKPLIDSGFILLEHDDSKALSDCKQSATPRASLSSSLSSSKNIKMSDEKTEPDYWQENGLSELMDEYRDMRKKRKKVPNERAEKLLITAHKKCVANGSDPKLTIIVAIGKEWLSFYENEETRINGTADKRPNRTGDRTVSTPASRGKEAIRRFTAAPDDQPLADDA